MQKGVSIIICSYNGAERIEETIRAAANQRMPETVPWEIILIDNASTDGTSAIANECFHSLPNGKISFSILQENKPGKIYALHQGIETARYHYFIICDDDNRLAPDYASLVYQILESDTMIGAVGGQSEAETTIEIPAWFESVKTDYAIGKQSSVSGDVSTRGYLWGAAMGSRTDLYKEMYRGFPSFLTGRNGQLLTSGEDSEYCQRLLLRGYKLWYNENLQFRHYIPSYRLQPDYREGLQKGLNASDAVLNKYRLANQLLQRTGNSKWKKFGMFIRSLLKYPFAFSKRKKERATDKLCFLSPVAIKPEQIMSVLRRFVDAK